MPTNAAVRITKGDHPTILRTLSGSRADTEPCSGEFVTDFSGLTLTENLLPLIANEKEELEAVLGRKVAFRNASDEDPA